MSGHRSPLSREVDRNRPCARHTTRTGRGESSPRPRQHRRRARAQRRRHHPQRRPLHRLDGAPDRVGDRRHGPALTPYGRRRGRLRIPGRPVRLVGGHVGWQPADSTPRIGPADRRPRGSGPLHRRVLLPQEPGRRRQGRRAPHRGHRARRGRREPVAPGRRLGGRRCGVPIAADDRAAEGGHAARQHRSAGAHHRRDRHRQGNLRAPHPREQSRQARTVRTVQLRHGAARSRREPAVRLPARRLHGRKRIVRRPDPFSRTRHAVP